MFAEVGFNQFFKETLYLWAMTAIQKKIQTLNKTQQVLVLKFIDDLIEKEEVQEANLFDSKIEAEINAGKPDKLAAKAIEDFKDREQSRIRSEFINS